MKKSFIAIAAVALIASACTKDNVQTPNHFFAQIGTFVSDAETKVFLGDKGADNYRPVKWETNDVIVVRDGQQREASFRPSVIGDTKTEFIEIPGLNHGLNTAANSFAFYYNFSVEFLQTAVENGAPAGAVVLYGEGSSLNGSEVDLLPQSALIRVKTKAEPVESIVVRFTSLNNAVYQLICENHDWADFLIGVPASTMAAGDKIEIKYTNSSTPVVYEIPAGKSKAVPAAVITTFKCDGNGNVNPQPAPGPNPGGEGTPGSDGDDLGD